jgi:hypothetical protein
MRSWHFKIFSPSFLITFLSPGTTSINMHVPCLLPRIMMSSSLSGIVLSVRDWWFHHMVTLPSLFISTDFGTWSYQCLFSNFTPSSLHMLKCNWTHYYYYYYYYYYYIPINCNK